MKDRRVIENQHTKLVDKNSIEQTVAQGVSVNIGCIRDTLCLSFLAILL